MGSEPESGLRDQSIRDFGDQWTRFTRNEGYYASRELLRDIVEPLLPVAAVEGARTADIGSGTGRIVRMLSANCSRIDKTSMPSQRVGFLSH